jgi:hypothetical protein
MHEAMRRLVLSAAPRFFVLFAAGRVVRSVVAALCHFVGVPSKCTVTTSLLFISGADKSSAAR